jgi:hypothetical protein
MPGAGTTLRRDARARFGVPLVQESSAEELELAGARTR